MKRVLNWKVAKEALWGAFRLPFEKADFAQVGRGDTAEVGVLQ